MEKRNKIIFGFFLFVLLLVSSISVSAATVSVTDFSAFKSAVESGSNDTVKLDADFTVTSGVNIKDCTIDLNGYILTLNSQLVISPESTVSFVDTASTKGMMFRGTYNASMISIPNKATLNIEGAVIDGSNNTTSNAGALIDVGGILNFKSGALQNNYRRNNSGGGLSVANGGVVNMTGGIIQNCRSVRISSGGNGGGAYVGGTFNMSGGEISKCEAIYSGGGGSAGGVGVSGGKFIMSKTAVIDQCKARNGGGVWTSGNNDSQVIIEGGTVKNCTATYGGGVQNNSRFTTAYDYKGESYTAAMIITGGEISGNTATQGGGVHNDNATANSQIVILGGTIKDNSAKGSSGYGGGIYLEQTTTSPANVVKNAVITGNKAVNASGVASSASYRGGGIYISSGNAILDNLTIENNTAFNGAGISVYSSFSSSAATTTLGNSKIYGNTAAGNGGGIYSNGLYAKLAVDNTEINDNKAVNGAGVSMEARSSLTTDNNTKIFKNIATASGGGLYLSNSNANANSAKIAKTRIYENSANNGGGIYITSTNASYSVNTTLSDESEVIDNKAVETGGGVYRERGIFAMDTNAKIYSNLADVSADDVYSAAGSGSMTLLSVSDMNLPAQMQVDNWYEDTAVKRYRDEVTDVYTVVASDATEQFLTLGVSCSVVYRVYYHGNGHDEGTEPVDSKEYATGEKVTVLGKESIEKTRHSFIGWNTKSDGSGITYQKDQTLKMGESDIHLYAMWKKDGGIGPETGDNSNIIVWVALMGVGLAGAGLALYLKRKTNNI